MYNYKDIESELGKRDLFPNSDSAAYFDHQSQTIHLNEIKLDDFKHSLETLNVASLRHQLGTMMHEATHWADVVGTLWGQSYLNKLYRCYRLLSEINRNGSEANFHEFVRLHDTERRLMHAKYYRTVNPTASKGDIKSPWGIEFSAGREFDASGNPDETKPIIFAKFSDQRTGEQVARQPIVPGALLEINAVWSEMRTNIEAISSLSDDEKAMENAMFQRELLAMLYDPALTLYTAPAHLLAYYSKTSDVLRGYELASEVSHVVLNLSENHYASIDPPESIKPWSNLFEGFRNSMDVGFAFKVISACVDVWQEGMDKREWLDIALERAGLPVASSIYEEAIKNISSSQSSAGDNMIDVGQQYLVSLGQTVLKLRSRGDTALTYSRIIEEKLPVVPMFDSNGQLIPTGAGSFNTELFNPEEFHSLSAKLVTWKRNFIEACR